MLKKNWKTRKKADGVFLRRWGGQGRSIRDNKEKPKIHGGEAGIKKHDHKENRPESKEMKGGVK